MDTIDFLFCCNSLSCNPDDGQFPEEEAPVDLPAPEPPTSGGLSDEEGGGDEGPRAARPARAPVYVVAEAAPARVAEPDEPRASWEELKGGHPAALEAMANGAYCDDADVVVDVDE